MANAKNVDYKKLFHDLSNICMTENVCGKCQEKECFVGYAREMIGQGFRNDNDTIPGGYDGIPHTDAKGGYDKECVLDGIAHTLQQCKSCKELHYDDCLINIVRSCYEVIAFGNEQFYEGSAATYLMKLQEKYPEMAAYILQSYKTPYELD